MTLAGYINPLFSSQYTGATNVGLIRGGYHFALPDRSSGAAQATYFLAHGGAYPYTLLYIKFIFTAGSSIRRVEC